MSVARHPVIPVIELDDADSAVPLAEALLRGGISIIEITLRTPAGLRALEMIRRDVPTMLTGAGTVLDAEQAEATIAAGAQFGVAPGLNRHVVEVFQKASLPFLPGVATPTELDKALSLGCSLLKFFPAQAAGGADYLQAIAAPFRHRAPQFCATGGIGPGNAGEYLSHDAVFAVGGSWLATRSMIGNQDWSGITSACREAVALMRELGLDVPDIAH